MKGKTGGSRAPRRAGALAVVAALAVLTACGGSPSSSPRSASRGSAIHRANLAYAPCTRAHGRPSFPNTNPSEGFRFSGQLNGDPNGPGAETKDACQHLLPSDNAGPRGATALPTTSPPGAVAADCLTAQPPCYTPMQLRVAYGIQPLLERGITGRGQTIVLPEFPAPATGSGSTLVKMLTSSDIRRDLARFDSLFGLPAAPLQVVNTLAHAASPWQANDEEVADTEIVHALAPGAAIREVLGS